MKVDLIRKYRWYIVGLIMSVIIISVSLSFCLWDDNSLKSLKASGSSGDYNEYIDVPGRQYKIAVDKYKDDNLTEGENGIANVGDIVTFGKYYQDAGGSTETDLRWIVVNSEGGTLTLLTEKVVAFGSFWNDEWYFPNNTGSAYYNQRYNTSTIREWLNSESRTDGYNVGFITSSPRNIFNGFYSEAFETQAEKDAITARTIGSMKGYYGDESNKNGNSESPTNSYGDLPNQKVWIPSWTEIYGKVPYGGNTVNDYSGDTQFQYFVGTDNSKKIGTTTAFASSTLANYTHANAQHASNQQNGNAWWWLRSPSPGNSYLALLVSTDGSGHGGNTYDSFGGVRPAVCLAR